MVGRFWMKLQSKGMKLLGPMTRPLRNYLTDLAQR